MNADSPPIAEAQPGEPMRPSQGWLQHRTVDSEADAAPQNKQDSSRGQAVR